MMRFEDSFGGEGSLHASRLTDDLPARLTVQCASLATLLANNPLQLPGAKQVSPAGNQAARLTAVSVSLEPLAFQ